MKLYALLKCTSLFISDGTIIFIHSLKYFIEMHALFNVKTNQQKTPETLFMFKR